MRIDSFKDTAVRTCSSFNMFWYVGCGGATRTQPFLTPSIRLIGICCASACCSSCSLRRDVEFLGTRLVGTLVRHTKLFAKDPIAKLTSHSNTDLKPHRLPAPGPRVSTTLVQEAWPERLRVPLLRAPPAPITNLRSIMHFAQSTWQETILHPLPPYQYLSW